MLLMNEDAPDAIRPLKTSAKISTKKKRHRPPFVCSRLHQSRFASKAFVANRCAPILARLCANVAERRCSAANVELFVRQNDSLDRIGSFDPLDRRAPKRLESREGLTAQS